MSFELLDRLIDIDKPPLAVCELGINHGGSLETALALVDAALVAGAEVIKLQTHIPSAEMSREARLVTPQHCKDSIFDVINNLSLTLPEEEQVFRYARGKGAKIFSTPFSKEAVDHLLDVGVSAFKIGSGECNNWPLIDYIASHGLPIVLSTGMHGMDIVRRAVKIFEARGVQFALMHCTNLYPTPTKLVRLGGILDIKREFPGIQVGLSDHTTSNYSCFGAVALGATFVEKHFCLSHSQVGPDIECSNDPEEWKDLMKGCFEIFLARGGSKSEIEEEQDTRDFAFASVVAITDLNPGDVLTRDNLWVKRPSGGDFTTDDYEKLLGSKVTAHVPRDTQLPKHAIQT